MIYLKQFVVMTHQLIQHIEFLKVESQELLGTQELETLEMQAVLETLETLEPLVLLEITLQMLTL
jgi:hypothetical protein